MTELCALPLPEGVGLDWIEQGLTSHQTGVGRETIFMLLIED